MTATLDEITDNFALLDDWEDRYRYLMELGRTLAPMSPHGHDEQNRVRGCVSQVWLERDVDTTSGAPVLHFRGDSDAHIVRGLVALALALFSGKSAQTIVDTDALAVFDALGLGSHLTPQRSNGLRAMVDRIKNDARAALA
ncbi:MAG: SufE family protein [Hyphomicrobiales bacterium]|nr:SufE family protein [Hyphomicrobiales bacterium]